MKNEMVVKEFGKKKMVRENVPQRQKKVVVKKTDEQDPDVLLYFGDHVNLEDIPDESNNDDEEEK